LKVGDVFARRSASRTARTRRYHVPKIGASVSWASCNGGFPALYVWDAVSGRVFIGHLAKICGNYVRYRWASQGNVMAKVDMKKELKQLYHASAKDVVRVDVPTLNYLMIDGQGDPNSSQAYAQAVEALFSVAYTAKFMLKRGPDALDYAVMPLEGLWWADDLSAFVANNRSNWKWTMMIMQPALVSAETIFAAVVQVRKKKSLLAIDQLRLESFAEGACAQILHVGPFTEEGPTIQRLHEFIESRTGLTGKHHEIYLTDIRRANSQKWKTVIRQPMRD
jgi:hypothetical protein